MILWQSWFEVSEGLLGFLPPCIWATSFAEVQSQHLTAYSAPDRGAIKALW